MDNDKGLIDQVPKTAWFAAGWILQGQIDKESRANKAAGLKPSVFTRIVNGIWLFLQIVIGGPVLLACAALALGFLYVAGYFIYAVVVTLLG